jgi:TolB-like protein/Flp pilus assembly protein TadD
VTDAPTEREGEGAFSKLRRRKVVQWSLAYAAAAWTLLQVIEYLGETYAWPPAIRQIVTPALALGSLLVLVLAWYHGDKGAQRVSRPELAILATIVALVGGTLWWYVSRIDESAWVVDTGVPNTRHALPVDAASIAVLPFVDMSPGKDQEYFADGIAEELLNLLAQIPQLRVISRSSAFSYKGKDVKLADVAYELNVAHILEGSVRKAGNQVRITAQLIDARSDTHLWSQTYDRPLDNIFAVQDEIAAAVVAQLKLKLLGGVPKARAVNPRAYALYLQASQLIYESTPKGYEQSIALYQQAIAIDANYAAAWIGLSEVYRQQAGNGLRPIDEAFRMAREAANKALSIDPDFAPAHVELGWIAMTYDGDLTAAAQHYEHALALEPTNPDIVRNTACCLAAALGRVDTAVAAGEYVAARDPLNPRGHVMLANDYVYAGRLDEAIASLRTALRLRPDYAGLQSGIGDALLLKGEPAAALAAIQKDPSEFWRRIGLPMAWHALGKQAESNAALAELIQNNEKTAAYNIAYVLAFRGEADRAFEWLDKAVTYNDPGLIEIAVQPLFANLHKDPRWGPFLHRIGKAPEQLAAITFDFTVPK